MRKLSKPSNAKRNAATAKAAKPVSAKPVASNAAATTEAAAPAVAKPAAHIARTVATVARANTNFAEISDRDNAYFAFYKRLIGKHGGTLTVRQIAESGERPAYNGSNKAHDAGVIVRLTKAGLLSNTAGDSLKLTPTGVTRKA